MFKSRHVWRSFGPTMFAIALGPTAGCPDGRDVAVGVGDQLNLEDCSGATTDCMSLGTRAGVAGIVSTKFSTSTQRT